MAHLPTVALHNRRLWSMGHRTGCVLCLLVLCASWARVVSGAETGCVPITGDARTVFLQTWSAHLQSIRSLHMTFRQEKHLRFLRRPLVTQGELWLVGEIVRYVSKNTAGETELELHVDQQTTRIYYPLLQTLEVMTTRGSQGLPLSIPFLGRNVATLNTEYDVTLCASSGRHVLRLIPRSPHSSSSEIQLTLEDFQPQEFSQIEKNGTRLIMNITTFTPNPEISAAQLELQIPPGTRVLYPLRSHPPGESRSELPEPNADRPASRP